MKNNRVSISKIELQRCMTFSPVGQLPNMMHRENRTCLAHKSVLVAVHARELTDVREDVLQAVGELEGIDIAQSELHVAVDDELRQP